MSFDLQKYYERINFFPEGGATAENLRRLHNAHATHIPFENLDVYSDKGVRLDPDSLFEKLVVNRRGGYCFEMNGLQCLAFLEAGFNARACLARIYRPDLNGFGPWSHRVTVVDIDGDLYVCDVGYGGNGFVEPILLKDGLTQKQTLYTYRVRTTEELDFIVDCDDGNGFAPMLGFDVKAAQEGDFEVCSYFTSTHPMSFFKGHIMCALATKTGKLALFNERLTINDGGEITVREFERGEMRNVLREYFGIDAGDIEF